jgi:hypothetical protein
LPEAQIPEPPGISLLQGIGFSDDWARTGGTGLPTVTGEQMFDERGNAFLFQAVKVGVFKERKVAGTADSSNVAENANGLVVEFVEFFTERFCNHGADYINLRMRFNSTLVLRGPVMTIGGWQKLAKEIEERFRLVQEQKLAHQQ